MPKRNLFFFGKIIIKFKKTNKQEGQDTHTQSVGLIFSGMSEERWEQGKEKERDMRFSFRVF
jgi:hypothetical protein